jgi:hypothetical protein
MKRAEMKLVFYFMLVVMFGFFVSCASVPKPQEGDVVEGTIVHIVNGFTRRAEKKSAGQKFGEWFFGAGSHGDFNYVKDKIGKIYFVQVGNEGRKDQRKFFLVDAEVKDNNDYFKIGDKVRYEIKYLQPEHLISPSYYHVATVLHFFQDENDMGQSSQNTPSPLGAGYKYNVAINGQNDGPYDMDELRKMVQDRKLTKDTLVWKEGMADWMEAGTVEELKELFGTSSPPPIPKR